MSLSRVIAYNNSRAKKEGQGLCLDPLVVLLGQPAQDNGDGDQGDDDGHDGQEQLADGH